MMTKPFSKELFFLPLVMLIFCYSITASVASAADLEKVKNLINKYADVFTYKSLWYGGRFRDIYEVISIDSNRLVIKHTSQWASPMEGGMYVYIVEIPFDEIQMAYTSDGQLKIYSDGYGQDDEVSLFCGRDSSGKEIECIRLKQIFDHEVVAESNDKKGYQNVWQNTETGAKKVLNKDVQLEKSGKCEESKEYYLPEVKDVLMKTKMTSDSCQGDSGEYIADNLISKFSLSISDPEAAQDLSQHLEKLIKNH